MSREEEVSKIIDDAMFEFSHGGNQLLIHNLAMPPIEGCSREPSTKESDILKSRHNKQTCIFCVDPATAGEFVESLFKALTNKEDEK